MLLQVLLVEVVLLLLRFFVRALRALLARLLTDCILRSDLVAFDKNFVLVGSLVLTVEALL